MGTAFARQPAFPMAVRRALWQPLHRPILSTEHRAGAERRVMPHAPQAQGWRKYARIRPAHWSKRIRPKTTMFSFPRAEQKREKKAPPTARPGCRPVLLANI